MDVFFLPFLNVARMALSLYGWVIVFGAILQTLIVFRIVNPYQSLVQNLNHVYHVLVEPLLNRIRQFLPMIGLLDLSPLALWLGLQFVLMMIDRVLLRFY